MFYYIEEMYLTGSFYYEIVVETVFSPRGHEVTKHFRRKRIVPARPVGQVGQAFVANLN